MKRFFIVPLIFSLLLIPFTVFASVDITLEDKSSEEQKSVGILVDTGTDTLTSIGFKVEASTDVNITQVIDQNSTCDDFTYTNDSNIITIACTLDEATVISGYVGTIIFTSTEDDYTFTVSKTDGLDLGTLTLGTVTDIEAVVIEDTTTTTPITTTQTTTSTDNSLTKYLPYILIGGAVILLISVVGIILSKKKEPKTENEGIQSTQTPSENPRPLDSTPPVDIDNVSDNLYTPTVQQPEIIPEPQPTIQETLEQPMETATPIIETTVPMQEAQPQETIVPLAQEDIAPIAPVVEPQDQSNDLAALISSEQQAEIPVMAGITPVEEALPPVMPETPEINTSEPLPDLQQLVNQSVGQVTQPTMPETQPTDQTTPTQPMM